MYLALGVVQSDFTLYLAEYQPAIASVDTKSFISMFLGYSIVARRVTRRRSHCLRQREYAVLFIAECISRSNLA